MIRTGSPTASRKTHGQPGTLVILARMETHPFGLRGQREKEMEATLRDDLELAWGPRIRLLRGAAGNEQRGRAG